MQLYAGTINNSEADQVYSTIGGRQAIGYEQVMDWYESHVDADHLNFKTVKELFKEFDEDDSKELDKQEFREFFHGLRAIGGVTTVSNSTANAFKSMDLNDDGAVCFDEIWKWMEYESDGHSPDHVEFVRSQFFKADSSGDGLLSLCEFQAFYLVYQREMHSDSPLSPRSATAGGATVNAGQQCVLLVP